MIYKVQNKLFFLVFIILLNLILWGKLYILRKQTYQTQRVLEIQQRQRANLATYSDRKYGFSFQYPLGWIMPDETCSSEPFCLIVTDYNHLLTEKQRNKYYPEGLYPETSDIRIFSKEQFVKFKTDLENNAMPQTFSGEWSFLKIVDKNGIQNIFYDIFSGTYIIETVVSHDNVIFQIALVLPVNPVMGEKEINIEKSMKKAEDLKQKKFNTATQKLINQYNQLLSTFVFTKSDFVFYQDEKTNLSFYYPLRYGTIVKRSFFGPTADFHFSDLHFAGHPDPDLEKSYNSLTVFPQQENFDYDKKRHQFLTQLYNHGAMVQESEDSNSMIIPNESQEEKQKILQRESKKTYIQSEVVGTAIRGMYYFMRSGNGVNAEVNLVFELLTEKGDVIKIELSLWSDEQDVFEKRLNTIFQTKFHKGLTWDQQTLDKWENDVNKFVQHKTFTVFKKELEELQILVESLQLL